MVPRACARGLADHPDRRRRRRIHRLPEGLVRRTAPAGYAVPHWPADWGGGMSVAEQVVLYSELAPDAPRLVLAFVGSTTRPPPRWPRAPTSRAQAPARDPGRRIGSRASPNPKPDRTWPPCAPPPGVGDRYLVNGQKLWASGGLRRLAPAAGPHRSRRTQTTRHFCFLMDTTPGIDVRPIRNAAGDSHFWDLPDNVEIPAAKTSSAGEPRLADPRRPRWAPSAG